VPRTARLLRMSRTSFAIFECARGDIGIGEGTTFEEFHRNTRLAVWKTSPRGVGRGFAGRQVRSDIGSAPWSFVTPQVQSDHLVAAGGTAIFSLNSMQVLRTSAVMSIQFSI